MWDVWLQLFRRSFGLGGATWWSCQNIRLEPVYRNVCAWEKDMFWALHLLDTSLDCMWHFSHFVFMKEPKSNVLGLVHMIYQSRVSNPLPAGCTGPRLAMNAAQHKIVNVLKTLWDFFVFIFNVWPKTTLLLPVWPRDGCPKEGKIKGDGVRYNDA